jgi:hypothetical protein
MHSPSYGRLWLANQLHPGDTVSVTEAQALVQAAERRMALRPLNAGFASRENIEWLIDVPGRIEWRQKAGINDAAPGGRSLGVSYGQIARRQGPN